MIFRKCIHDKRSCHETYPGIFCHCPEDLVMHRERCPVYRETGRRWAATQGRKIRQTYPQPGGSEAK